MEAYKKGHEERAGSYDPLDPTTPLDPHADNNNKRQTPKKLTKVYIPNPLELYSLTYIRTPSPDAKSQDTVRTSQQPSPGTHKAAKTVRIKRSRYQCRSRASSPAKDLVN